LSSNLWHATVTVISDDDCEAFYQENIDDCTLCTLEDDTNGPCYVSLKSYNLYYHISI
jgi:hypothetical protein